MGPWNERKFFYSEALPLSRGIPDSDRVYRNAVRFSPVGGAADHVVGLNRRFAACFKDRRNSDLVGHSVQTLVTQHIVGIALGYEDLVDHDGPGHDPVMPVLADRFEVGRSDCAPLVGESTLNRLELSQPEPTRLCQDCRRHRHHRGPAGRSVP